MTVGSWEPGSDLPTVPSDAVQQALTLTDADDFPAAAPESVQPLQPFMTVSESDWHEAIAARNSDDLKQLCRFFTLAEDRWPDWFAGDRNPVIWICRELKQRGDFPDKALTVWIKQHTQNRFLPYGNILG